LGLYDVAHNGLDWVLDWYDPDYYLHSPIDNPQGPDSGTAKVVRGGMIREDIRDSRTTKRREEHPQKMYNSSGVMDYGIRCVVNTPQPLPKP
jgi:formylglycine-generating enzyme required for sulfatase activity